MSRVFSTITALLLLATAAAAVWRARDEPRNLAFALAAYAEMALLFSCVLSLEKLPADDDGGGCHGRREMLKSAVWVLSTVLSLTFCYRVAEVLPAALAAAAWAMALLVAAAGFYLLFLYHDVPSPDHETQGVQFK